MSFGMTLWPKSRLEIGQIFFLSLVAIWNGHAISFSQNIFI